MKRRVSAAHGLGEDGAPRPRAEIETAIERLSGTNRHTVRHTAAATALPRVAITRS